MGLTHLIGMKAFQIGCFLFKSDITEVTNLINLISNNKRTLKKIVELKNKQIIVKYPKGYFSIMGSEVKTDPYPGVGPDLSSVKWT